MVSSGFIMKSARFVTFLGGKNKASIFLLSHSFNLRIFILVRHKYLHEIYEILSSRIPFLRSQRFSVRDAIFVSMQSKV